MGQDIRSITQVGTSEVFELQVARGQIPGHTSLYKFGFNPDVDNSLETVWSQGGLYSYLSSASVIKISSGSASDTSTGTGARTVSLSGLDADYNEISEVVTLNGQTAVSTVNSFLRLNKATVETAGSGGQNAGVIYGGTGTVTTGVPANIYLSIAISDNQTLMSLWTVPANHTAYLQTALYAAATTQNNKFATVELVARPFGSVFQVKDKFVLTIGSLDQFYNIPLRFEEKTDIEVRCVGDSAAADIAVSAGLDLLYIKNEGPL